MYAIEARGLTKRYKGITAVENLNLRILRGELFSLLGLNGAGKTTAIKMLCCLSAPSKGDALLEGYSIVSSAPRVKEVIGVSPQETAVAPNLTVKENLELMCGVHGFSRVKTCKKTQELSQVFDLLPVWRRKASKLSGGWQRKLSIAMALVSEPAILFLDEPTLGLDVIARSGLWETIRMLKGKTTIVLTTHYMEEADALSDRVGILKDGRLLVADTPENIKAQTGCSTLEAAFITLAKENEL